MPVKLSNIDSYKIIEHNNITKYLPDDYEKSLIKIEYLGLEELSFKNKKDEYIGEVNFYYDNILLDTEKIYLETEIKLDIIKLLIAYKYVILIFISFILFIILSKIRTKKKLIKK